MVNTYRFKRNISLYGLTFLLHCNSNDSNMFLQNKVSYIMLSYLLSIPVKISEQFLVCILITS